MPYSIVTKDGITIDNIPDDTPPDAPELKQRVAEIRAQKTAPPAEEEQGFLAKIKESITGEQRSTEESQTLPEWTGMPELNQLSLASAKTGLGTLLSNPQETVQIIKSNFPGVDVRQDEKGNFILKSSIDQQEYVIPPGFSMGDIPRAIGSMAAFTPAGRAASIPGAIAATAGTQAAVEASQAATGGQLDVEPIVFAGGAGAIAPAIGKGIQLARGMGTPPSAAQQAVKQAEAAGVKPMTSDVLPPRTFAGKLGQTVTERIPVVGTGGMRASQQTQRIQAVDDVLRTYGTDAIKDATENVTKQLLKKRSGDIAKYVALKGDVIEKLPGIVPVDETISTINRELATLKGMGLKAMQPGIDLLDDFKSAFVGKDLKTIEMLRRQLGENLKDQSMASVKSNLDKAETNIYRALNKEMGDFIKATGERRDFVKWSVGNKRLAEMVGELNSTALKTALNKGQETPEMVRKLLFSQNTSDIRTLSRNLTAEGRANARTAILQDVAAKSFSPEGGISPEKFISQMRRNQEAVDVFFKGQDKQVVDGLIKALKLTRRASEAAAKPPTGAELTAFATPTVLTWLLGTPMTGAAATATIGGMARVYESPAVRNLLLQIAKTPSTKAQTDLLAQLTGLIQAKQMESK